MRHGMLSRPARRLALILSFGLMLGLLPATVTAADGDDLERAIRVKDRIAARLLESPGIVGVGVGLTAADRATIRVYTTTGDVPVPKSADGVGLERVVTGLITARACQDSGDPTQRCNRPVPIGVSVGHPKITAGTIGARVKDTSGNVYALSNNHVLANSNDAKVGDSALQPGPYDGGTDPADRIGTLAAFKRISFNYSACDGSVSDPDCNTMDAAIAATTTGDLGTSTLPGGYGTPSSTTVAPALGQFVTKCGRTTGCTTGTVDEINVAINVCYKPRGLFFCKSDGVARFVDQISISDGNFSAGGDSGSLVVTSSDRKPVGLLFAGSSTRTFANKIGYVLTEFGVSIDDGSGTPPPPGDTEPPATPEGLTATGGEGSVALSWTANGEPDLAGYKVYRGTVSGTHGTLVATVGKVTSYTDSGLTSGMTYYYVITAFDTSNNQSAKSNEVSATPTSPPAASGPSDLSATHITQGTQRVDLAWTGGASSIDIFRAYSTGAAAKIATVSNSGSYRDNLGKRPASGTYTYHVCNAESTTDCSNPASVTIP